MPNYQTPEIPHDIPPGNSVLGGASGGLSYDGALHDAGAAADRSRRREAGRRKTVPPQQTQAALPGVRPPGGTIAAGGGDRGSQ